jgi:hypothetical protein
MINVSIEWMNRIDRGEQPTPYIIMETGMGWRAFGGRNLSDMDMGDDNRADGEYYADGEIYAGVNSLKLLSFDARVISFGNINRTLKPKSRDLFIGYNSKEKAEISITLDNKDHYFNDLLKIEPILNKRLQLYLGYEQDPFTEHIPLFNGEISDIQFDSQGKFTISALESLSDLSEYYYLNRAGRFDNPLNTNDKLPIVYGDCSDGPNWKAPCIDTVNYVYCFAGHAVLSVANGNDIRVFVNGLEVDPIDYVFNESDSSYENMATITFASAAAGLDEIDVVVGGKGKDTGGVLIENIIDIIDDLLFNVVGWDGELEATKKAMSYHLFEGKSYVAAGVITDDFDVWEKLKEMTASFYGTVFLNSNNKLVIDLDLRKWNDVRFYESNAIMTTTKTEIYDAAQMLDGIVNHFPVSYAYDYYNKEFRSYTDDSAYHNLISQSTYGDRSPGRFQFYWIRELATVNSQQDVLVDRLNRPIWQLKVKDISGVNLHLELGDIIQYTAENYYSAMGDEFINQYFLIIGVDLDLDTYKINWTLVDTQSYRMFSVYADGDVYANGEYFAGDNKDITIY